MKKNAHKDHEILHTFGLGFGLWGYIPAFSTGFFPFEYCKLYVTGFTRHFLWNVWFGLVCVLCLCFFATLSLYIYSQRSLMLLLACCFLLLLLYFRRRNRKRRKNPTEATEFILLLLCLPFTYCGGGAVTAIFSRWFVASLVSTNTVTPTDGSIAQFCCHQIQIDTLLQMGLLLLLLPLL